jgi:hypothetical protein
MEATMRVNVYAEEITGRVEIVEAVADNTGARFFGVRFYLESSDKMVPPQHPDDDSSAVTFWIKSGKSGYTRGNEAVLKAVLTKALALLDEVPERHPR